MIRRLFLRSDRIRAIIDAHHLTHAQAAQRLGFTRSYWSQLVNGRRPLAPTTRRRLLDSGLFVGHGEEELWERHEVPMREAS